MMTRTTLLLASVLVAWACGSKGSSMVCEPGETQPCICVGGGLGVQECNEEGSGWDDCVCESADTGTDTAPDPAADGTEEPATDPAVEPTTEPLDDPIAEPIEDPADDPTTEPIDDPVEEPVPDGVADVAVDTPSDLTADDAGTADPPTDTAGDDGGTTDTAPDTGTDGLDAPDSVTGGIVGDACTSPSDCTGVPVSPTCLTSVLGYITMPGGYCSGTCTTDRDCGTGAECVISYLMTACLKTCTLDSECRTSEGYACVTLPYSGAGPYCFPYYGTPDPTPDASTDP